jgi:catechol 2,3-dioxygenase-like lactoylglutathione lyase family enzyme
MLSHLSLGVSDLDHSAAFYDAAMAALGYVRVWTSASGVGYGPAGGQDKLALFPRPSGSTGLGEGFHLAFAAATREAVDAFHAETTGLGAADLGPPGLRPHYGESYYAAFVADPDGRKLEAVCQ